MAWIESHQSLGTHRKLYVLCNELGISDVEAIGHLHYLWWWSLDNAPHGDLTGIPSSVIAEADHWNRPGRGRKRDPERFISALINAEFLVISGELTVNYPRNRKIALHDWEEYAGKLVARREANREKQRAYRNRNVTVTLPSRNLSTVPNQQNQQYISTTGSEKVDAEKVDEPPEFIEQDPALIAMATCYESNIGMITTMVADELKLIAEEFPPEWFTEAVKEAVKNNARNLRYVSTILERWKTEGYKSVKKGGGTSGVNRENTGRHAVTETREEASRRRVAMYHASVRKKN